tara:strand:- start:5 stop:349 length:345 start_codon:yes stop_codon:yes gene_type:complete
MATICQGPKCHTYDTTDRKRGPKGNKRNQTRTVGTYGYGNRSFCTLGCQDDWWTEHGTRAVDYFGRVYEPIVLDEANAWRQVYNHDRDYDDDTAPRYIERNMITNATRPLTPEQ